MHRKALLLLLSLVCSTLSMRCSGAASRSEASPEAATHKPPVMTVPCSDDGWSTHTILSSPAILHSVWGSGPRDIWTVGDGGLALHFDGSAWERVDIGTKANLTSIWGASASQVWVATNRGEVYFWNGREWSLSLDDPNLSLYQIRGCNAQDIWVVGDDWGVENKGAVIHWNGTKWRHMSTAIGNNLTEVWCRGNSTAWLLAEESLLRVKDGVFEKAPDMPKGVYQHLWGFGPDDLWLGGHDSMAHFDGQTWTRHQIKGVGNISSIWGSSPAQIMAVSNSGWLIQFDGRSWKKKKHFQKSSFSSISGSGGYIWTVSPGRISIFHPDLPARVPAHRRIVDQPPSIRLERPAAGDVVSGLVRLLAFVSDDLPGVSWMHPPGEEHEYFLHSIGGPYRHPLRTRLKRGYRTLYEGPGDSTSILWDTCDMPNGSVTLELEAIDNVGQKTATRFALEIANKTSAPELWGFGTSCGAILHWHTCGTADRYDLLWSTQPGGAGQSGVFKDVRSPFTHAGAERGRVVYYRLAPVTGNKQGPVSREVRVTHGGHCSTSGWCREHPVQDSAIYSTLWGSGPDQVWAAGRDGVISRWDGGSWRHVHSSKHIWNSMWGSGPQDVWVVGDKGSCLHWDGSRWSQVDTGTDKDLLSIHGTGPKDIWTAGYKGTILRWDGLKWSRMNSSTEHNLNAIWAASEKQAWALGNDCTLLRWDGKRWTQSPPVPGRCVIDFSAVWGSARDDVWISGMGAVLFHFDGDAWKKSPSRVIPSQSLRAIWGSGRNDAWAGTNDSTFIHWDGEGWSTLAPKPDCPVSSFWGSSSKDIWASCGARGLLHWSGHSWNRPDWRLTSDNLVHIWGDSPRNPRIVSANGQMLLRQGRHWKKRRKIHSDRGRSRAFWGLTANKAWLIVKSAHPGKTTLHELNGDRWSRMKHPFTRNMQAIWASSPDDIWTVHFTYGQADSDPNVTHWNGETWEEYRIEVADGGPLNTIWGSSADDVWVSGASKLVFHWNGTGWERFENPLRGNLINAMWGTGPDDVWMSGELGKVAHYDGKRWKRMESGSKANLLAIWGRTAKDVWFSGSNGTLLHYDGRSFEPSESGVNITLYDLWGAGNEVWAVGGAGTILRRTSDTRPARR